MRCAGASVSYTARLAETEAENARLRTLLDFSKTLGGKLLTGSSHRPRCGGAIVVQERAGWRVGLELTAASLPTPPADLARREVDVGVQPQPELDAQVEPGQHRDLDLGPGI